MDDDDTPTLDAAAGLASLASAGPISTNVVSPRGASKAPMLTKKKKVLTSEECVVQSLRRKNHRHLQEARNDSAAASSLVVAASKRVATRLALLMLGLNPGQHGLVIAVVVATSIGSSPVRHTLPDSPHMSTTSYAHDFHTHNPQASRLSNSTGSGSPEVSMVAPAMLVPMCIDHNTIPVGSGSSSRGAQKWHRELPTNAMGNARNLFNKMPIAEDEANRMFLENIIYEGAGGGIAFDPDETQIQDAPFMVGHNNMGYSFGEDNEGMADPFIEDQLGMDNSYPLEHEFPEGYDLEEEDDEVDSDGEPLFLEEELPTQANAKKKLKSKRTKAYTKNEDKLLYEC
ncbi:dna repair protein rhp54 [Hordeum vulgare]|nr:dna repair protein rhp54 [Hordeum vulgare]